MKGIFSITAPENATLIFSYIGYEVKEVAIAGKTELNISLTPSANSLNEVVVTALVLKENQDP